MVNNKPRTSNDWENTGQGKQDITKKDTNSKLNKKPSAGNYGAGSGEQAGFNNKGQFGNGVKEDNRISPTDAPSALAKDELGVGVGSVTPVESDESLKR